jgi:hypothetical protein
VQRLPVALSAAALFVALLGATPLGKAAEKTVKKGVTAFGAGKAGHAAARGPRGRRGPKGPRGLRGFQGAPGDTGAKGDKGDAGPSNAYEFKTDAATTITGTTADTATIVAAPQTALPAGKYAVTTQIVMTPGGSSSPAYCRGRAPGPTGPYVGKFGWFDPTRGSTLTLAFAADLPAGGTVNVGCWQAGTSGSVAGPIDLVAIKVADLAAIN